MKVNMGDHFAKIEETIPLDSELILGSSCRMTAFPRPTVFHSAILALAEEQAFTVTTEEGGIKVAAVSDNTTAIGERLISHQRSLSVVERGVKVLKIHPEDKVASFEENLAVFYRHATRTATSIKLDKVVKVEAAIGVEHPALMEYCNAYFCMEVAYSPEGSPPMVHVSLSGNNPTDVEKVWPRILTSSGSAIQGFIQGFKNSLIIISRRSTLEMMKKGLSHCHVQGTEGLWFVKSLEDVKNLILHVFPEEYHDLNVLKTDTVKEVSNKLAMRDAVSLIDNGTPVFISACPINMHSERLWSIRTSSKDAFIKNLEELINPQ